MKLFLDTNIYISFHASYESSRNLHANQVLKSIMSCKHEIVYSKSLLRELRKKSKEHNFDYVKTLENLIKLRKAKQVDEPQEGVGCIHAPDNLFIEICKRAKIPFVSFDRDAAKCSENENIETYNEENSYLLQ